MAQATSGEIACSHWLTRVTCRSVSFRIGQVRITGFASHFVYKRTTKGTLKSRNHLTNLVNQALNNLCIMSRTMNNQKESLLSWSLRENIRSRSFMYVPCPTSSVCTVKTSV